MTKRGSFVGSSELRSMMEAVDTKPWTPEDADAPDEAEQRRLQQLFNLGALDSPRDRLFQSFVEQALKVVPGTTVAAVSLVDAKRQWFKAIVGWDRSETCRSESFCSHTIQTRGALVVRNALEDPRFAQNPLVVGPPGIRFYAGIKLTRAVGALCVIGAEPRDITTAELDRLHQLARFVDIQLLAGGTLKKLDGTIHGQPQQVR